MLDTSRMHMRCSPAPRLHRQQRSSCRRRLFRTSEARVPSAVGRGDAHSAGEGGSAVAGHTWLQRQRVLHHEPHPSDGDIIELNCGGSVMVTSRSTLRQVKGSLLCLLFDPANSHLLRHDAAGRVFLDHDPAAFGLLLRHLRELRAAAGYGSGAVLLPAIPPADAPSFRALNHHLGLGICEDDIAAAVRRGAALAAAAAAAAHGTPPPLLSDSHERPSSPYASRPVPPGSPQQQQQQQWLRQQWQQQCSPGGRAQQQQQQYAPAANHPADITEQAASNAAAAEEFMQGSPSHQSGCTQQVSAADWDALTYPQPGTSTPQQQQQPLLPPLLQQHIITDMLAHQQSQQEAEQLVAQGSAAAAAAAAAAGGGSGVHIDAGVAGVNGEPPTAEPYSAPAVHDFYMLTSPATGIWGNSSSSSSMPLPLRVSVLTEADMLVLQHAQRQRRGPNTRSNSSSNSSGGVFDHAAEAAEAGPFDFDVFCSTSSSRGRMGLSVVVRESAELDNVFVGLTTPNQADQRGLQIPSFGWHQVSACAADAAPSYDPTEGAALDNNGSDPQQQQQQQQQQRWATGDLVQLALDCTAATGNRLTLTVNNLPAEGLQSAAEIAGSHSLTAAASSSSSSSVSLPAFQEWCWYIALYRGTQVVAAVLEPGSYSIYTGDTKLKRYTS